VLVVSIAGFIVLTLLEVGVLILLLELLLNLVWVLLVVDGTLLGCHWTIVVLDLCQVVSVF
jgi:hypothetical protein